MTNTTTALQAQYRKKPVVIDAWQINRDDPQRPGWVHHAFLSESIDWCPAGEGLYINTLEGCMLGGIGDWLIRGVKGELYPCKSDIFAATYEPAALAAAPAAQDAPSDDLKQAQNGLRMAMQWAVDGRSGACATLPYYTNGVFANDCESLVEYFAARTSQPATPAQDAAATVPEGWKLVPVEPTPEMGAWSNTGVHWPIAERIYRAMLEATPPAPQAAPTAPQAPALVPLTAPEKPGVYAWTAGAANALVLVDRRPSGHSPGGVLNGHVINSTMFYDGCAVNEWGQAGKWVLLHDFEAGGITPTTKEQQ